MMVESFIPTNLLALLIYAAPQPICAVFISTHDAQFHHRKPGLQAYRDKALYHHDKDGGSRHPVSRHSTSPAGHHLTTVLHAQKSPHECNGRVKVAPFLHSDRATMPGNLWHESIIQALPSSLK